MLRALYEALMRWHWNSEYIYAKARVVELDAAAKVLREEQGLAQASLRKAQLRLIEYARLA